ncbi:MAG: universal stress protein [Chloroflexi bacterium]|nr:universal stress protein [Chloroflexota bacterium]
MKILICTDGSLHAEDALRFGGFIAQKSQDPVKIMGVAESWGEEEKIKEVLSRASEILGEVPNLETLVRRGHAAEEILREIEKGDYELVILGARGRRGITRFLLGSTAARIVENAPIPVLIVRRGRPTLERILICTAGGEPSELDIRFGGRIARLAEAPATLLHVMSQLPLSARSGAEELEASFEVLVSQGTREALHLQSGLEMLKEVGVEGEARIRRGLVVDEILGEAQEGDYDLIVIGAHQASGLYRFLLDDITRQVVLGTDRPVLVVRPKD